MSRLAALLRRLADRLDPPRAAPAEEVRMISRQELRGIQQELLQMIDSWIYLSRSAERDDGLMWIPRDVLETVAYFIGQEIDARDRDFERIERDPTVVLR